MSRTSRKGKRVGNRSGKPGDHRTVVQRADLPRAMLEHDISDGHLAVSGHSDDAVAADAEDGRTTNGSSYARTRNTAGGRT